MNPDHVAEVGGEQGELTVEGPPGSGRDGRVVITAILDSTTPGGGGSGVAAVPTLSEWALMLLGTLAAALGLHRLRRRA